MSITMAQNEKNLQDSFEKKENFRKKSYFFNNFLRKSKKKQSLKDNKKQMEKEWNSVWGWINYQC